MDKAKTTRHGTIVFHNGYCVIHNNKRDKYGLIDKKGNWMLKAEYDAIYPMYINIKMA